MKWHRRSWLIFLAGLLLGLAAARCLTVQGLVRPIRIASGSMMPTLHGAHVEVVCEDCSFSFACDATSAPETGEAVCPNCGFPGNALQATQLRSGQRVTIDRLPVLLMAPRRWDLIAFQDPQVPANKSVKRVVGFGGETISIRHGDLFADGQILRKPIDMQRAMAVLIHDDAYRPTRTHNLPDRWTDGTTGSSWQPRETGYQCTLDEEATSIQWLEYHNWRCFASPRSRSEDFQILDHYGYNQNTSRRLHPVTDVTFTCRLKWLDSTTVWLRIQNGRDDFEVEMDRAQRVVTLRRAGTVVRTLRCALNTSCQLEFGVCDQQVLLSIDRRLVVRHPFEPSADPWQAQPTPLAIGSKRGRIWVDRLQVYRDVYYLDPGQLGRTWTLQADVGSILTLGDNVPISRDSRHWANPGLSPKSLIGRVLTPF